LTLVSFAKGKIARRISSMRFIMRLTTKVPQLSFRGASRLMTIIPFGLPMKVVGVVRQTGL
jgi:hypothetical protein